MQYGQPYAQQSYPPQQGTPLYRQNFFVPPGARTGPVPGPGLRITKLLLGIGQLGLMLLAMMLLAGAMIVHSRGDREALSIAAFLSFTIWELVIIAYAIVNAVWIYKMWSWIPPEQRHTNLWKKYISPGQALGFMFIPYFNIYWMFVVYLGLGDIFERLRVTYPTQIESPKNLGLAMLICSFVFFPAAPILYFLFAKRCETLALEIQAKLPAPGYGGP